MLAELRACFRLTRYKMFQLKRTLFHGRVCGASVRLSGQTTFSRSATVSKWDLRGSCPSCVLAQQIKEEEKE